MAFGDDADEDAFAARGLEDVVDRPGVFTLRHRAWLVAGHLVFDHVLRDQEQAVLEQPDADVGTPGLAAALLIERRENRDRPEHAAHDVVGRRADALGLRHGAGHGGEAGHHLHDFVEGRAVLVRTGQETLVTRDDQIRMSRLDLVEAETLLRQQSVAKILEEYISGIEQLVHRLAVVGLGQVQHNAALAAIEQRKERYAHAAERTSLVAGRRLDLDDLCAKLSQDHAAARAHHHVGHLDHPHARQRQFRSGHRCLHLSCSCGWDFRLSRAI